jgi:lipopolysaccharide export system protein LptA
MPVAASAEKADRDKPMHIEADNLVHDELRQISTFSGRAVLNKGTMVMRGAKIEIREDADGYQYGVVLPEPNKRAFFRQKREGVDEFVEGEGLRLEYNGKTDSVKLVSNAEVRRYKGPVLNDQMAGNTITYENLTDLFMVDGKRTDDNVKSTGGRVRATLAPRKKAQDPQ